MAQKYKANLDRLVERIVRNPTTSKLQFANNISSVGGIGFFTHSATKSPDERYLEVILGAPEIFETKGEYSAKVFRLFSHYGAELLSIVLSDAEIYQEKELSGYALNFAWRNTSLAPNGPRVTLDRAIIYFPKEKVRAYLRREVPENSLLGEAVIFAVEEEGPAKLVSYSPEVPKPDFRPPVQEETLAGATGTPGPVRNPAKSPAVAPSVAEAPKAGGETSEKPVLKESTLGPVAARRPSDGPPAPIPSANPEGNESSLLPPGASTSRSAQPDGPQDKNRDEPAALPANATLSEGQHGQAQEQKAESEPPEAQSVASSSDDLAGTPSIEGASAQNAPLRSTNQQVDVNLVSPPKEQAAEPQRSVAASPSEKLPETRTNEQMAVVSRPKVVTAENKAIAGRPILRPLEGYIVQLSFSGKNEAQRWAETLERRGFSVSLTEAGGGQTVRVRIGNFAVREEADRHLKKLRQEGLTGIVLNLPESFRPEVRNATGDSTAAQRSSAQ